MNILGKKKGWMRPATRTVPDSARRAARAVYDAACAAGYREDRRSVTLPACVQVLEGSPQEQIEAVYALLDLLVERIDACTTPGGGFSYSGNEMDGQTELKWVVQRILQRSHPYTEGD